MSELWACIDPHRDSPRILITNRGKEPVLKARMSVHPRHPRALPMLLEAVALWQGQQVRAALVAEPQARYVLERYHDVFADPATTLHYSIDYVPSLSHARREHRDRLDGMGRFQDMKQLLLCEVAR